MRTSARPVQLGRTESPITRQSLQELLTQNRESIEAVLCPHIAVDDGQLLLPFGSDQCACFEPPTWIPHDVARHRPGQTADSCCRCRGLLDPERRGLFMPAFSPSAGHNRLENRDECEHTYDCSECKAIFTWRREGRLLHLEATKYLSYSPGHWRESTARPTDEVWLMNIDASPFRISPELKHITWCSDDKCWTSSRLHARLAKMKDRDWWHLWQWDELLLRYDGRSWWGKPCALAEMRMREESESRRRGR